jgi:hypothetical protein
MTRFRETVKALRPDHRRVDQADRLAPGPGDVGQCDLWFPPRKIPLEDGTARLLPVLVMTAAHSRFMVARIIPTRRPEDLLLASWKLLQRRGQVPAQADLGQRVRHRPRAAQGRRPCGAGGSAPGSADPGRVDRR